MTPSIPRPRNWLLLRLRCWHAWIGMSALLMLVLLGLTGIYLNHPDFFGLDPAPPASGPGLVASSAELADLVPLSRALSAAHAEWGPAPLQFVQLRSEGDRLIYRVRRRGSSDEVILDARTGNPIAVRRQFREIRYDEDGGSRESQVSWTRVMYELHTGRILGFSGRLVADAAGTAVLLLAASGVYLFVVPRWRRWRKNRAAWPKDS